jgi:hypothetical protein
VPPPTQRRYIDINRKYIEESKQLPVQLKNSKMEPFYYIIFPKLLKSLVESEDVFKNTKWPEQNTLIQKAAGLRSLDNPPKNYTSENINSMIWVT